MKKNLSPFDDLWTLAAPDAGNDASIPTHELAHDTLLIDDGDQFPVAAETATTIVTSAAKPVASIATLANYLVNGFWQYNATIAHHWASNTITYNINALNSAEKFLAQSALQAWSEVANITFVQTSGTANITFSNSGTMQAYASGTWNGSGAITSMNIVISSDWVTTDGGANDGKTGIDSYAYQTYIHEIGHALGLGHQGPYNGSASYSTNATYANDTWQYSIMSYFSEPNYSGSSYRYVVTPQMADIYAVVSIYGAATTTRTGDTVYGFNSNAGTIFSFGNYTSAPALTIYDAGGNDTLDCSGYSAAQTIDLHAGAFSSIGNLVNNIGIALNAIIEKAIGGNGNDKLIASDTGCTLSGGGGNDTLTGGAGSDTAAYSGNKSNYTISYSASTLTFTVFDKRAGSPDGTDTVSSVDFFQFADGTVASSVLVGPPNLSAQVFPSSSSAAAGGAISVSAFVVNYGTGPAAASTSKIYLSTDPNITTSDLVLATINSGVLAAVGQSGYYDAQKLSMTLPANLASGTYYIGAMADYNNQIAESDETDNTYNVAQITVTGSSSPPNLSAQVFPSSSSAAVGTAVSVSTFVVNYGNGPAAGSTSKIYLSADPNITTSDLVLATINSGSLAAVGQSGYYDAQKLSVTLPANLAPGTYYIGAMADYNNQIVESNEIDNTYNVAQITVTGSSSPPNLSAQVFPSSSSAAAGAAVSVSTFVVNYGNGPATGSTSKIYLSADPNVTTSDLVLATINSGSLAAVGQSGYYDSQKLSVTLPANLAPGTYYIGAMADYNNQIAESNETDNVYNVAQITVTGSSALNLSAETLSNSVLIAAGTAATVSSLVADHGSAPAAGSISKVYLASDTGVTTSNLVQSIWAKSARYSGYHNDEKMPPNPASGTQNIVRITENSDQITEINGSENMSHLGQVTLISSLSTGPSPIGEPNVFVDNAALHGAFLFTSDSSQDALSRSQWDNDDAFAHSGVNADLGLMEHVHFPVDTSGGSPIHNAAWEIAQHHLGDFIIK